MLSQNHPPVSRKADRAWRPRSLRKASVSPHRTSTVARCTPFHEVSPSGSRFRPSGGRPAPSAPRMVHQDGDFGDQVGADWHGIPCKVRGKSAQLRPSNWVKLRLLSAEVDHRNRESLTGAGGNSSPEMPGNGLPSTDCDGSSRPPSLSARTNMPPTSQALSRRSTRCSRRGGRREPSSE